MNGSLTPYILAALSVLIALVGWLAKRSVAQGEAIVAIQTAFKIYLEGTSKGAARVLDSPNPAPPEMRTLLRKYQRKELTDEERGQLRQWLRDLKDAPDAPKSERSAAVQLLASMEAMRALSREHH